jgi:FixJ family two-component response regulator
MNGRGELIKTLKKESPEIKSVLMSGYTDNIVARQGVLKPGIIFINKPLRPISLANKIRIVLNGTGGKNDPFPFCRKNTIRNLVFPKTILILFTITK